MTPTQKANVLISFFCTEYKRVTGSTLNVNRHTAKWGFQDLITDVGEDRARELIKYYFKTNRTKYDVNSFLNIYDQLNKNYEDQQADRERRARLREETRLKVEKWEEEHGNA